MPRYFFEVAYKGSQYHGWQVQDNASTIQGVIDEGLYKLTGTKIKTIGSGRTDTGVHALQQFFHADINEKIDPIDFNYKLNAVLPIDISIKSISMVSDEAHTRFDAISRSYQYHITSQRDPFKYDTIYYFASPLDIELMNHAAQILLGTQDFECFSKSKSSSYTFICTITKAVWKIEGSTIVFHITANRFLRGMVRAIVGTLLEIGLQKKKVEIIKEIIASKDRKKAGRSVPANGLFLTEVNYPKEIFVVDGQ